MKYLVLIFSTLAVVAAQQRFHQQQQFQKLQQQNQQQPQHHQQQQQHHQQQQQHHQQPQQHHQQQQQQQGPTTPPIPIISYENVLDNNGKFSYSFENGDGIRAQQNGELKYIDQQNAGESVQGGYSYTGDDGKTYQVTYIADEYGYRAIGDHLPTPPPIPEAIAKAIASLPPLKE